MAAPSNVGKTIGAAVVGPQADVPGLSHSPYGALDTVASLTTSSNGQTITGKLITGNVTVRHSGVEFVDCEFRGRVNVNVQGYPSASATFRWCQFGRGTGYAPGQATPQLTRGNLYVFRCEFSGEIDGIQASLGVVEVVESWFHDGYDGPDDYFGGGPVSSHSDPIQFNFYLEANKAPETTLHDVIIQGCRFDSWVTDAGTLIGSGWGRTDTVGRHTSGAFILNPKDPYVGIDGVTFRDNYVDGHYDYAVYVTASGATSESTNVAIIDNIFKKHPASGTYGTKGVASIQGVSGIAFSRNLDADTGATISKSGTVAAGESNTYPSSSLFSGTGGSGSGGATGTEWVGMGDLAVDGTLASGSVTPAFPASYTPTAGHYAIVHEAVTCYGTSSVPSTFAAAPAGWTVVPGCGATLSSIAAGNTRRIRSRLLYRKLTGGDSAPTLTTNADASSADAQTLAARMTVVSGVHASTPFDPASGTSLSDSEESSTVPGTGLTTTGILRRIMAFAGMSDDETITGGAFANGPTLATRGSATSTAGADVGLSAFDGEQDAAGATGAFAATATGTDPTVVHVIALRPADTGETDPITGASATPGDNLVDLAWTNPGSFDSVVWRRGDTDYPASPTDGTEVYSGTGTSTSDTDRPNGVEQFYRGWAVLGGVYSNPVDVSATPEDTTAPGTPANVTVTATGPTAIEVEFDTPSDADVIGYLVRMIEPAGVDPAGPADGILLAQGAAAPSTSYGPLGFSGITATSLRVAVWAIDDAGNTSTTPGTADLDVLPSSAVPPVTELRYRLDAPGIVTLAFTVPDEVNRVTIRRSPDGGDAPITVLDGLEVLEPTEVTPGAGVEFDAAFPAGTFEVRVFPGFDDGSTGS